MALSSLSTRSPEYTELARLMCRFAGVQFEEVLSIGIDLDMAHAEVPRWRIEKRASATNAKEAMLTTDKHVCQEQ